MRPSLLKRIIAVIILSVAAFSVHAQMVYIGSDSLIKKILPHVPLLLKPGKDEHFRTAYRAGCAWYLYEFTKDKSYLGEAEQLSKILRRETTGSMSRESVMAGIVSSGNGFRLTHDKVYREDLSEAANWWREFHSCTVMKCSNGSKDSLLIPEPKDGPCSVSAWSLPDLAIAFEAARNDKSVLYLKKLAIKYADRARENLINPDHMVTNGFTYNGRTGEKITYKDGEIPSGSRFMYHEDRNLYTINQAALIYGFALVYRETKDDELLKATEGAADAFIRRLPADGIPREVFTDSTDGGKNPVAGAMAASALFELATHTNDVNRGRIYKAQAKKIITALGAGDYLKPGTTDDYYMLLTNYYYLEALLRLKRLEQGKTLYEPL